MPSIEGSIAAALSDFREVARLAGAEDVADEIVVEVLPRPHKPPSLLPSGQMAVYAFFREGVALKVGKVGPKSAARYTSQHYSPASSISNLARSILSHPERFGTAGIDQATVGAWIKQHTDRANLLIPARFGLPMLSLLEAFLHVRWRPLFEGRPEDGRP